MKVGFPYLIYLSASIDNFLAVDVGIYLPAYEQVSIYFLKDIAAA